MRWYTWLFLIEARWVWGSCWFAICTPIADTRSWWHISSNKYTGWESSRAAASQHVCKFAWSSKHAARSLELEIAHRRLFIRKHLGCVVYITTLERMSLIQFLFQRLADRCKWILWGRKIFRENAVPRRRFSLCLNGVSGWPWMHNSTSYDSLAGITGRGCKCQDLIGLIGHDLT